jgi:uncharacterized protein (TIGR02453 family)
MKKPIKEKKTKALKTPKFSKETFKYFDLAKKNKFNKEWFKKNESLYTSSVKEPFSYLIERLHKEFALDLKRIPIDPKKITRPLRPSNKAEDLGWIKDHSHITLWEPKTSLFEWNPGIHIQFGTKSDDNLVGAGLYMTSGRQISKLREAALLDYETLDSITKNKKFKTIWGQNFGDKYKRFPKGFDVTHPAAEYLWYKQFFVAKNFKRSEVQNPKFIEQLIKDLKLSLPFLNWIRQAVGIYSRPKQSL